MSTDQPREKRIRELRSRLDAILRRSDGRRKPPAAPTTQHAPRRPIVYRRDLPEPRPPRRRPAVRSAPAVRLEDAVAGSVVHHPELGPAFVITTPLSDVPCAEHVSERLAQRLAEPASPLAQRLRPVCDPDALAPTDLFFLDLETTGLSCTPLFLIGTMTWHDGRLCVRQILARNYAEEPAAIALALQDAAPRRLLVSFNGKTFDLPFLRIRALANRLEFRAPDAHFDLLHECRRIWRERLPNCRLQTLEAFICRRSRYGDIPGAEIPDAYHDFVRTGNARRIVEILHHNTLDLVTLADLMTRFPPLESES
jgi:uncharacterized protein YprB with RNaseH-like and TPR domain